MPLSRKFLINIFGNVVEFYDFTLFAFLSSTMAPLFFPSENQLVSLLVALSVFGVSFFMRPLGAIFLGYLGDIWGRKVALKLAVVSMALSSFAIAVMPTYDQIGVCAPILFVLVRLIQGFSVGGEYSGAVVSSLESVDAQERYLAGGFVTSSSVVGTLLASIVTVLLHQSWMPAYSWRFGYFFGALMGGGVYWLVHCYACNNLNVRKRISVRAMFAELWRDSRRELVATFTIASFSGVFFYTAFSLASVIMVSVRHWDPVWAHMASIGGMVTYLACVPLFALIAGHKGGVRVMLVGVGLTLVVGTGALLMILHCNEYIWIVLGNVLLSFCCAVSQAPINGLMCMAFPQARRYSGFGAAYGIGISLFGGLTGMILVRLVLLHASGIWVLVYLQTMTLVAGVTLYRWQRQLAISRGY
ncbi:MAG: MFS transporter [Alphaproteobacteria bacterium]|nr:MAG: MFS transporter [Alphaproteobacteria bacterium]